MHAGKPNTAEKKFGKAFERILQSMLTEQKTLPQSVKTDTLQKVKAAAFSVAPSCVCM